MFNECLESCLGFNSSPVGMFLPLVVQVVELISGGAQIAVTNENKMHYLNLLAQYRLASQVRDEVEHFLKGKGAPTYPEQDFCGNIKIRIIIFLTITGLNELVPENLLAIFDENELEVCDILRSSFFFFFFFNPLIFHHLTFHL